MRGHAIIKIMFAAMLAFCIKDAFAHCDTLDGPVVEAARAALDSRNIAPVLIWVQDEHQVEIRKAFQNALDVRVLGASANELADKYFFETVVRLHRQGEGAPYTGLKPAGTDFGPAIPAADRSLESGLVEDVVALLTDAVQTGVHEKFEDASSKRDFDPPDIAAGRRYVASYVDYIHYVERIYEAATSPALDHLAEHD